MKSVGMATIALLAGTSAAIAAGTTLFDNGPLITGDGPEPGTFYSEVQSGNTSAGFGHQAGAINNRVADDFVIPASDVGGWRIDTVCLYTYQTNGSPMMSSFTAVNLRIWNGRPGDAGSTIVFGDTTTNRLATSIFSNIYRIFNAQPAISRPVYRNEATVGVTLPPGTYWLDWQTAGTLASGPWAPSISVLGARNRPTDNGRQFIGNTMTWNDALDTGNPASLPDVPQDFPFLIKGEALTGGCPVDLNGDGMVTIADFLEFLNLFSAGDARAEFDGMPGITVGDFLAFLNAFSKGC